MTIVRLVLPQPKPAGDGRPLDNGGEPPDDEGMEIRVAKLEEALTAIKIDVAVIKANGATKSDIAECKAVIADVKTVVAEGQTKIITWVVGAIFVAQLLPMVKDFIHPSSHQGVTPSQVATPAQTPRHP